MRIGRRRLKERGWGFSSTKEERWPSSPPWQARRHRQRLYRRHRRIRGNHHLRQSLVILSVPCLQQPEAYVGGADKLFDAASRLTNDGTRAFLAKFMRAFAASIAA